MVAYKIQCDGQDGESNGNQMGGELDCYIEKGVVGEYSSGSGGSAVVSSTN